MISEKTATELRTELDRFDGFFENAIEAASAEIERRSPVREQRRAAVLWKIRMTEEVRDAITQEKPVAALVDTWSLCVRMEDYLQGAEGRMTFGESQPVAVRAAQQIEQRIEEIARAIIPEGEIPKMAERIHAYAQAHPLRGKFTEQTRQPFSSAKEGSAVLTELLGIPLAPLMTLGKVNEAADSFRDLKNVGYRFTEVVEDLPAESRWQLQLLAMNLEEMETVQSTLRSFQDISKSSVRLSDTAEQLPQRVREEMEGVLTEFEKTQPELRATITEVRQTTAGIQNALTEAQQTAETVERTVCEVRQAGEAWESTAKAVKAAAQEIATFRSPPSEEKATAEPPASQPVSEKGFDVNEYTAAANSISTGAQEIRRLLVDLERFADSDTVGGKLQAVDAHAVEALDRAAVRLRDVVDHLAWRLGQLIALGFVLALIYRWVGARVGKSSEPRPATPGS